jgi:hypothetical protein
MQEGFYAEIESLKPDLVAAKERTAAATAEPEGSTEGSTEGTEDPKSDDASKRKTSKGGFSKAGNAGAAKASVAPPKPALPSEAPHSIREFIDRSCASPLLVADRDTADPKESQIYITAYATNGRLTSEARQIISRMANLYPGAVAAFLRRCGVEDILQPNLKDFPPWPSSRKHLPL